jgi:geranylgeranyl reductase family protein
MLYDVIVVGAGPAGSTAARVCAQRGLRVLLLEKATFPRPKLCAGGVSVRTLHALETIGVHVPKELAEQEIHGLQMMGPDLKSFEVRCPHLLGYTVLRTKFDQFLVQEAVTAGAELRENHAVTSVERQSNQVICQTAHGAFVARLVIGADGAAGVVGRSTGLRLPSKQDDVAVAVEVDAPIPPEDFGSAIDPSLLILWFLWVPLGYYWAFPRRQSLSLGVGGAVARMHNMPAMLETFAKLLARRTGVHIGRLQKIRGHLLPATGFQMPVSDDRVLLAGDAGGLIDAFSGQGICYAVESGILAARTAVRAVDRGDFTAKTLEVYPALARRLFGEELRRSISVAKLIHAHLYGGFRLVRHLQAKSRIIDNLATGTFSYDWMFRNPLRYVGHMLMAELRARLKGQP